MSSPEDMAGSDAARVGGTTATVLTFDTHNNNISVRTFDVYTGKWREHPEENYTVKLFSNLMKKGGAVSTIKLMSMPVVR